ncbi:MAG: MFS transporter [Candidatus Marinimicrobia bacterium]|nr:MFS transporter [Candidatus Neomarinimicrobiota bacterium]
MKNIKTQGWSWVPSIYYAEGLPYAIVIIVSTIMYKNLGLTNTEIALYTSWLYLPWVIKPLWSPLVEILKTNRFWIISMQIIIGSCLAGIALTLPSSNFLQYSLAFMWLLAFSSATHDIAVDGFYMMALPSKSQAWFIGIRNTFYRFAILTGQGLIVILAGVFQNWTSDIFRAWSILFMCLSILFLIFGLYHSWRLPHPKFDSLKQNLNINKIFQNYFKIFKSFFTKPNAITAISFMLLYRLGEAQLSKIAPLFMLDSIDNGGLGLSNIQLGFINGTIGLILLTLGGILGGFLISKHGLKHWIFWMAIAMKFPDFVYVYMASAQPESFLLISSLVAIEQFGYGFGFTAYLVYTMLYSEGKHKTAHYAICTGFMALGMMLPGMMSGILQDILGYQTFFIWIIITTIPGILIIKLLKIK